MKKIKINFSGMTGMFDLEDNFILNILKKYYEVEISDNPDYLIYSVASKNYLDYNCVRIYYTPENLVPDFNLCDYAIGFHYLDFEDRYFRYPVYMHGFKGYDKDDNVSDLERAKKKHLQYDITIKTDFCAFVYSNSQAVPCRTALYDVLDEYKRINSGGRYLNNVGGPVADKLEFQSKHKFVIAFENTSSTGYSTEKIVHAFSAGAIPIYWGNPEITKEFNPKSFINCHEFGLTEKCEPEALEKIVSLVKKIDNDNELYESYLKEPAFVESYDIDKQNSKLESFLRNIFDQPLEKAYRRNRYYWGERYEFQKRIGDKFYWQLRKLIPVRDFIRKIVKK